MQARPILELISFNLCPFVQRSVITLLEKGIDFKITYIDLAHRPAWFMKISPLGKVPVLRVGDAVIFESAVINEYIDEANPPPLHPADPLRRAENRAWIEFGSGLINSQYEMMVAKDKATFDDKCREIAEKLAQVEAQLPNHGPFFNGAKFSLVEAAYAPVFMRFAILEQHLTPQKFITTPCLKTWCHAMLARPAVQQSVIPGFAGLLVDYLRMGNFYISSIIKKGTL